MLSYNIGAFCLRLADARLRNYLILPYLYGLGKTWIACYQCKYHQIKHIVGKKQILSNIRYRTAKPRKFVCPRKYQISFSGWKWKILVWFKRIFDKNVFLSLVISQLNLSRNVQTSKVCKKQLDFDESCVCKLWYFSFDFIPLAAFRFPETVIILKLYYQYP